MIGNIINRIAILEKYAAPPIAPMIESTGAKASRSVSKSLLKGIKLGPVNPFDALMIAGDIKEGMNIAGKSTKWGLTNLIPKSP